MQVREEEEYGGESSADCAQPFPSAEGQMLTVGGLGWMNFKGPFQLKPVNDSVSFSATIPRAGDVPTA